MTETEERQVVVKEALSWQQTPFVWEACIKGVGVDCGRFLAGVFNGAGIANIDIPNLPRISPQWFMLKSDDSFVNIIKIFAEEYQLQPREKPKPGDVIVVKMGRDWGHSAIVVDWPCVVGAAMGFVVTRWTNVYTSPQYGNKPLRYFDFWRKKRA